MFLKKQINKSINNSLDDVKRAIEEADAIMIGAGAGLSTAAGFTYSSDRFLKYFRDMEETYGFHDMYSGGFYPYKTLEEMWAYWSRSIYVNRYMNAPKDTYTKLFNLVKDKNYFVLTTNVDHMFQKSGFAKERLFYTQGDYGLFQCSEPCHNETYDNEEVIKKMVLSQGFKINEDGELYQPLGVQLQMQIPSELVPHCPVCGKPMSMNLRCDSTFVEDEGWHKARDNYQKFLLDNLDKKIVFLELGVGYNTPGIIKYPFWKLTKDSKNATYICLNFNEAYCPDDIKNKSICINGDIDEMLNQLQK